MHFCPFSFSFPFFCFDVCFFRLLLFMLSLCSCFLFCSLFCSLFSIRKYFACLQREQASLWCIVHAHFAMTVILKIIFFRYFRLTNAYVRALCQCDSIVCKSAFVQHVLLKLFTVLMFVCTFLFSIPKCEQILFLTLWQLFIIKYRKYVWESRKKKHRLMCM